MSALQTMWRAGARSAREAFASAPRSNRPLAVVAGNGLRGRWQAAHAAVPMGSCQVTRFQTTDTGSAYFAWHPDSDHDFKFELFELPAATPSLERELAAFTARLELDFADPDLLLLAVTDAGFEEGSSSNSRMVALGGAAMRSAVVEYLYFRYPNLPGEHIRNACDALVSDEVIWNAARNIGLQHLIRTDVPLTTPGAYGPLEIEIATNAFAAVTGAVFLDQGAKAATEYALDLLVPVLEHVGIETFIDMADPKKTLERLLLEEDFEEPTYEIIQSAGRHTHQPTFLVSVFSGDVELADGASYSIEKAEQQAARAALMARYSEKYAGFELPSSWGSYSVGDIEEYVTDMHESVDDDETDPNPSKN